jgi:arginine repressor
MSLYPKALIIVHILKILHNLTSEDYPVTQTAIVQYLNAIGISCTRKTVGRNLNYLILCGVPIKRKEKSRGGYYYDAKHDSFFVRAALQVKSEGERQ